MAGPTSIQQQAIAHAKTLYVHTALEKWQ